MRTALAASCLLTLLAIVYLSASLLILQPPRANVPAWFTLATMPGVQSILTLTALRPSATIAWLRPVVLAGAGVLVAVAVWRVRDTLTSTHFEGYNLLLGLMLVIQATLTVIASLRTTGTSRAFGT